MRGFGRILAAALLAVACAGPGPVGVAGAAVILSPGDGTSLRTGEDALRNHAADHSDGMSEAALSAPARNPRAEPPLRVCADPNNMPFSNRRGEGFENKLAALVADALRTRVEYTWHAQRRGFIRQTLKAGRCDVVMGMPNMDMVGTTRPYYRSGYVFVTRAADGLTFSSMDAPELAHLRIGAHLIGDDGANTPPMQALGLRGIVDNVRGYTIYGDYRRDSPPMRMFDALVAGEIDVAAAWGPQAGWYAGHSAVPLRIVPITDTVQYLPLVFQYSIGMGGRREDVAMKDKLNTVIVEKRPEIQALLKRYSFPTL